MPGMASGAGGGLQGSRPMTNFSDKRIQLLAVVTGELNY